MRSTMNYFNTIDLCKLLRFPGVKQYYPHGGLEGNTLSFWHRWNEVIVNEIPVINEKISPEVQTVAC